MAVLVMLSVGTGYLFSVGSTFLYGGPQFYEASSVLLVFILLGHWLEMRARAGATDAIRGLLELAPPMAMARGPMGTCSLGAARAGIRSRAAAHSAVLHQLPHQLLPVDDSQGSVHRESASQH